MKVHTRILLGMVLGIITGALFGAQSPIASLHGESGAVLMENLNIVGELFMRLLKMVVVPLVFVSMVSGIASMEDMVSVGRQGIRLLMWFTLTTMLATIIGIGVATVITPGHISSIQVEQHAKTTVTQTSDSFLTVLRKNILEMVPSNPFEAFAKAQILQVIVFAIFFGIGITSLLPEQRTALLYQFQAVNDVMVVLVNRIISLAPYGVFTLVAVTVSREGIAVLGALAAYVMTVLVGLILHLGFYMIVIYRIRGITPKSFILSAKEALLVAFSTSSSAATLPLTMKVAEQNLGVPRRQSAFVLPLGATVNMDGTALYQGVAVLFICQAYGHSLSSMEMLTVVFMATLASIGAAGIPGAGLMTLVMVMDAIRPELVAGIGLILGVDRILDMCRTALNVCGDLTACVLMDKLSQARENSE